MTTPEQSAIDWFLESYPNPPIREDGSIDFESLCGEFLVEGVPHREVKHYYNLLPANLIKV